MAGIHGRIAALGRSISSTAITQRLQFHLHQQLSPSFSGNGNAIPAACRGIASPGLTRGWAGNMDNTGPSRMHTRGQHATYVRNSPSSRTRSRSAKICGARQAHQALLAMAPIHASTNSQPEDGVSGASRFSRHVDRKREVRIWARLDSSGNHATASQEASSRIVHAETERILPLPSVSICVVSRRGFDNRCGP